MNIELVIAHWRHAKTELAASDLLAQEEICEPSISSSYYAIMHAANAALQVHGVASNSHNGVRNLFGKYLIQTKTIERKWATYLNEHNDSRLSADYDIGATFSVEDAEEMNAQCHQFIERMRRYLLTQGFTEEQLAAG